MKIYTYNTGEGPSNSEKNLGEMECYMVASKDRNCALSLFICSLLQLADSFLASLLATQF